MIHTGTHDDVNMFIRRLGVDPSQVYRVIVDMKCDDLVRVYVVMMADVNHLDFDILTSIVNKTEIQK